ncbi:MAG: hypothetical protein VYD19_02145, partial [Myxococcota bacterium]|nr:hypothetical protein [Myxococcota bacterium]
MAARKKIRVRGEKSKQSKLHLTPIGGKPRIGVIILARRRNRLFDFSLAWHRTLAEQNDSYQLELVCVGDGEPESAQSAATHEVHFIPQSRGASIGERFQAGLDALRERGVDAFFPLAPGELLTPLVLEAYQEKLRKGVFFLGCLDLYLFDPQEQLCSYWPRHQDFTGVEQTAPAGLCLSISGLDQLELEALWPTGKELSDESVFRGFLNALSPLFERAPKGSCLLQGCGAIGGKVLQLKSELGRVLFDENNWRSLPTLEDVDFEIAFEDELSDELLDRVLDFDERVVVDILIEENPENSALWIDHYSFSIYKFLPYAN